MSTPLPSAASSLAIGAAIAGGAPSLAAAFQALRQEERAAPHATARSLRMLRLPIFHLLEAQQALASLSDDQPTHHEALVDRIGLLAELAVLGPLSAEAVDRKEWREHMDTEERRHEVEDLVRMSAARLMLEELGSPAGAPHLVEPPQGHPEHGRPALLIAFEVGGALRFAEGFSLLSLPDGFWTCRGMRAPRCREGGSYVFKNLEDASSYIHEWIASARS